MTDCITRHLAVLRAHAEWLAIRADIEFTLGGPDEHETFLSTAGDVAEERVRELDQVVEHLAPLGLVDPDVIMSAGDWTL